MKIVITKSQRLEDGSISGMFKIMADKVTKSARHELVDLEGEEVEVARAIEHAQVETPDSAVIGALVHKIEAMLDDLKAMQGEKSPATASQIKNTGLPLDTPPTDEGEGTEDLELNRRIEAMSRAEVDARNEGERPHRDLPDMDAPDGGWPK